MNEVYYHPMVTIFSLGAHVGGTDLLVDSLMETLRKIERYLKILHLGAS
jgi:hypothetical protein